MNLELKDVLPFYLRCQVLLPEYNKVGTLVGIDSYPGEIWILNIGYESDKPEDYDVLNDDDSLTRIKPILRPLEFMTDREKEQAGFGKGKDQFGRFLHYHGWNSGEYEPKQFVWLCKNSFDIFNLIPRGLAIDKTKYESQPLQDRADKKAKRQVEEQIQPSSAAKG